MRPHCRHALYGPPDFDAAYAVRLDVRLSERESCFGGFIVFSVNQKQSARHGIRMQANTER